MSKKSKEDFTKRNIIGVSVAFIIPLVILFLLIFLSDNSYNYEKVSDVTAIVIDKEYKETTSSSLIGPVVCTDLKKEYFLTLQYNEVSTIIQNKTLYDALDIGSTINVDLYVYYDKDGNITSKKLVLK